MSTERMNETVSGILCVNKPEGMTSHDVVYKIRRLYGTSKAGHTGTLDPMASGVLVVLVGRAVKASEYLLADKKEYIATLKLGQTTDTLDTTGKTVTCYTGVLPDTEAVKAVVPCFTGEIMQTPPMYSAIKTGGKKLYELARKGEEIEREARKVTIHSIEYLSPGHNYGEHVLKIVCSKGTYIRSLCDDIGRALGCGAVMSGLIRTGNGAFNIYDSYTIATLSVLTEAERFSVLLPVESAFTAYRKIVLPDFFARLAECGNEIYLSKLRISLEPDELVTLYRDNRFFALGQVRIFPDGPAIKPIKQF